MKLTKVLLFITPLIYLAVSCSKDDDPVADACTEELDYSVNEDQLAADIAKIDQYLLESGLEAIVDTTGLRYIIKEQGIGDTPEICKDIAIVYTGRLMSDSTIFDTTAGPVRFALDNLIVGWKIGIPKIKEGGRIQLFIPSQLAYGSPGRASIPENANLIFDIILYEAYIEE